MKIVLAQINPTVGALRKNVDEIIALMERARSDDSDMVVFPEMSVCGYPPEDLLLIPSFIDDVMREVERIVAAARGITVLVGTVRRNDSKKGKPLFNTVAIIVDGVLVGYQDKSLLPTYDVFNESRYFEPAQEARTWELCGYRVGITICEDIWYPSSSEESLYHCDPFVYLEEQKPDILINLSASPFHSDKIAQRRQVCSSAARRLHCPVALCNQVGANDSIIFDGNSIFCSADGEIIAQGKGFEEDFLIIDTLSSFQQEDYVYDPRGDICRALILGIRDYFHKLGFSKACLGLSGGIDSAVVAYLAAEALGSDNVLAIMMPSHYSTPSSYTDASGLIKNLGIESICISIEGIFESYLDLLQPYFAGKKADETEENLQARIRGMILMALSNKHGTIVLSCGNKSEMALGYATLYGDMCGGLGVISDVLKTQVYDMARWINREKEIIPHTILIKEPSAELRADQKDSDSLPDYALVDAVLKGYVEEHKDPERIAREGNIPLDVVRDLIRRIHLNEYKRRQSPPGLRISAKAFSKGRQFPIVQRWR